MGGSLFGRRLAGAALGSALAAAVYVNGARLFSLIEDDWESFVLLPATRAMTVLAVAVGAVLGVYAASVVQHRQRRIATFAAVALFLFAPLAGLLLASSRNLAAALFGFIGSIAFLPVYLPLTIAGALLLERLTRNTPQLHHSPDEVTADLKRGPWLETYAAWAVSIGLLGSVLATFCFPLRPASHLERLLLQVEGKRCDDPSYQPDWLFFDWSRFSDQCKVEAAERLANLGEAAAAAEPRLSALVVKRRDVDTGDGIVPVQSSIAFALAQIGDPAAIESLERAQRMQSLPGAPVGREAIAEALKSLRPR